VIQRGLETPHVEWPHANDPITNKWSAVAAKTARCLSKVLLIPCVYCLRA